MNCPGCGEEIYEEELIDGDCPLCGETVRQGQSTEAELPTETETEAETEEALERIVGFFEGGTDSLLDPVEDTESKRRYVLEVPPSILDRLRPKRCDACGRWHLKIGRKEYDVLLEGNTGEVDVTYYCVLCEPSEPESED
ncbi:MAG: hypothetical protein SV253_03980 [Halobacteria archaeon]|nr:hypothetical protein [Halobacteria archaeon]